MFKKNSVAMSIVGDNIRALREREGLTQQELADAIHVSRETVNKWESGAIESLRERNVAVLRNRFSLTVDDLRSEHKGLAAQLHGRGMGSTGLAGLGPHAVDSGASISPTRSYVSDILWQDHPEAFAVEMDSSMSRVLPAGCLAFVDPQITPANGAIVLAEIVTEGGSELKVRRLHLGSTKALLSAESYEADAEDIVVDTDQLHVRGTVFWYQPSGELA